MKKPEHAPRPNISKSSMSEFDECQRRWALRYEWFDFDYFDFPEQLKRDCQFHSKLMGNEAFAGQVVHDVIEETLRARKEGGLELVDPFQRAKEIAREYAWESELFLEAYRSGEKPPKIHRQALARHFFQEGFDGHSKAEFRKSVETALMNFFDSQLYRTILETDPAFYELAQKGSAPWFMDGHVPVYANFDFALRTPGKTTLFDWKTGKVSPRAELDVKTQLHTYAAYAMDTWRTPPEELRLVAAWLSAGKDQIFETNLDPQFLKLIQKAWRERHFELSQRRARARGSVERLFELFPATGMEKKNCKSCSFRFCEGYVKYLASVQPAETAEPVANGATN